MTTTWLDARLDGLNLRTPPGVTRVIRLDFPAAPVGVFTATLEGTALDVDVAGEPVAGVWPVTVTVPGELVTGVAVLDFVLERNGEPILGGYWQPDATLAGNPEAEAELEVTVEAGAPIIAPVTIIGEPGLVDPELGNRLTAVELTIPDLATVEALAGETGARVLADAALTGRVDDLDAALEGELVRAETTAQQPGLTAATDRTGLVITFEVGATPWEVEAYEPYVFASAAGVTPFLFIADAADVKKAEAVGSTVGGASYFSAPITCREKITAPGIYTRKSRLRRIGANQSITVGANLPEFVSYIQARPMVR